MLADIPVNTQGSVTHFENEKLNFNHTTQRCELHGSTMIVNSAKNLYTLKPFAAISVTTLELTSLLESFLQEFQPPPCFRVVALMAGYNEADVLSSSITDLLLQGVDVHFIDNWSTDSTFAVLRRLQRLYPQRITSETFPTQDSKLYNWASILERKTQLASSIKSDWFIHVDPDELRESPWGPSISLRRALFVADALKYNVVNFGNVVVFHPLKRSKFFPKQTLRTNFLHFSINKFSGDSKQSKAWKSYYSSCAASFIHTKPVVADLASSGGHIVQFVKSKNNYFPGHQLFPFTFFLRHYPIRSQEHGTRKVFSERTARWNESERNGLDWHKQYDNLDRGHNFLSDDRELFRAHDNGDLPDSLFSSFIPCPNI